MITVNIVAKNYRDAVISLLELFKAENEYKRIKACVERPEKFNFEGLKIYCFKIEL